VQHYSFAWVTMHEGAVVSMFGELHDPRGAVHKKSISEGLSHRNVSSIIFAPLYYG
jgi:hypothetical protein